MGRIYKVDYGEVSGGGYTQIVFALEHVVNSLTITWTVSVNGAEVSGIENITASSQGNFFDDTTTFTANGHGVSWRVRHPSESSPILYNEITIDGTTSYYYMMADSSLALNNNLTNAYAWELPLAI